MILLYACPMYACECCAHTAPSCGWTGVCKCDGRVLTRMAAGSSRQHVRASGGLGPTLPAQHSLVFCVLRAFYMIAVCVRVCMWWSPVCLCPCVPFVLSFWNQRLACAYHELLNLQQTTALAFILASEQFCIKPCDSAGQQSLPPPYLCCS